MWKITPKHMLIYRSFSYYRYPLNTYVDTCISVERDRAHRASVGKFWELSKTHWSNTKICRVFTVKYIIMLFINNSQMIHNPWQDLWVDGRNLKIY